MKSTVLLILASSPLVFKDFAVASTLFLALFGGKNTDAFFAKEKRYAT